MYKIVNTIKKYTEAELSNLIPLDASWHKDVTKTPKPKN